jgi:hypothetical protein
MKNKWKPPRDSKGCLQIAIIIGLFLLLILVGL